MSDLDATFARCRREGRIALVAYLMTDYPTSDATPDLAAALVEGGFDIVELGVPFSDPLADGAAIQRAGQRALANGSSLARALATAAALRERTPAPVLLMGYYNPFQRFGLSRLSAAAAGAGVQGLIVPDLPPEEAGELEAALAPHAIHNIRLLAPTSGPRRVATICQAASGFLYCVALTGVTGARQALAADLGPFLARVRRETDQPLAVGLGLARPEHVAAVARMADGAVVGSAIVELLDSLPPAARASGLRRYAASLRAVAWRPQSLQASAL
ncbi:MAG: tryptophan synthase subunit alpha [Chloroflexota bacterium]